MGQRLDLDKILKTMGAAKVYFQPPENTKMVFPCIVYKRDFVDTKHANNLPYSQKTRYEVTVIDEEPDSPIVEKVKLLPETTFLRFFVSDQLNHDIYQVFF
jgi:hypothetical protein